MGAGGRILRSQPQYVAQTQIGWRYSSLGTRSLGHAARIACILFLCRLVPMLLDAIRVMATWGFEDQDRPVWVNEGGAVGHRLLEPQSP